MQEIRERLVTDLFHSRVTWHAFTFREKLLSMVRISTSRNENRICEIPVEKSFTKIWESLNNYTLNDTFIRFERFASFIIISINYYCHISNNRLSKLNLHASNFNYVKFSRSLSLDMIYDRKKGKKIPQRMVIARKGVISKNAKQFRDSGTKCETVRELVRRQISLSNLHTRNLQTGVLHPSEGRDKEKEREGGGLFLRLVIGIIPRIKSGGGSGVAIISIDRY